MTEDIENPPEPSTMAGRRAARPANPPPRRRRFLRAGYDANTEVSIIYVNDDGTRSRS